VSSGMLMHKFSGDMRRSVCCDTAKIRVGIIPAAYAHDLESELGNAGELARGRGGKWRYDRDALRPQRAQGGNLGIQRSRDGNAKVPRYRLLRVRQPVHPKCEAWTRPAQHDH